MVYTLWCSGTLIYAASPQIPQKYTHTDLYRLPGAHSVDLRLRTPSLRNGKLHVLWDSETIIFMLATVRLGCMWKKCDTRLIAFLKTCKKILKHIGS